MGVKKRFLERARTSFVYEIVHTTAGEPVSPQLYILTMHTMSNELTAQDFKTELYNQQQKQLLALFENDKEKVLKFFSACVYCFNSNDKLAKCDRDSVIQAFMKIAEYNLYPSTVSGEAYVLPYWNGKLKRYEAQFQLGYKGVVTLLYRAGMQSIYSDIVRKNDYIKIRGGTNNGIEHEYALGDRGEAIGVYVVATVNGEKVWKYMAKDEVLAFRKFSQSAFDKDGKESEHSPWHPDKDLERNMWRKTCIKQLSKVLPMNETIARAQEDDNTDGDIREYEKRELIERGKEDKGFRIEDLLPSGKKGDTTEITDPETGEILPNE